MNTVGTPLLWGSFAVIVVIMLAIDLLMQGTRDQNQGRVDRKTMAMAELLKRGGLSSQEPQDANKEGLNQAQRQFLAQRLLAG